jgi:hypothetical protein
VPLPDDIPGLGRRSDRPTVNASVNLTEVRLTPVEGFVLSRVDGVTSYEDLCQVSGQGMEATLEILRKLRREGILLNPGEKPEARKGPTKQKTLSGRARTGTSPGLSLLETHDDGTEVDGALLAEGPGLDADTKARIVRLHRRLKNMKPHEILGVSPGADAAMVKRAYFAASKEVHPDRFYGKDLGVFRDKLSDIFAHLTRAFEQLKK